MRFLSTICAAATTLALALTSSAIPAHSTDLPQPLANALATNTTENPPHKTRVVVTTTPTVDPLALVQQAVPTATAFYTFTTVFTGVSVELTAAEIAAVAALPGVQKIYPTTQISAPEPEQATAAATERSLRDVNALELMNPTAAVTDAQAGTGKLVAVIDSGLDFAMVEPLTNPNPELHYAFRNLSDEVISQAKYPSASSINARATSAQLAGEQAQTWINNKVVWAQNCTPGRTLNPLSAHGTHVASIAVGNPLASDELVAAPARGVLPNAQLAVFNCEVNGENKLISDAYAHAIDVAVSLGADALNLSFGTTGADWLTMQQTDDAAVAALAGAKNAGVGVAVADGNDAFGFQGNSPTSLPSGVIDYGTAGSPATSPDVIAVASVNNQTIPARQFTATPAAGGEAVSRRYQNTWVHVTNLPAGFWDSAAAVVYLGDGTDDAKWQDLDATGKLVAIDRGSLPFAEMGQKAAAAGAVAVVVINKPDQDPVSMDTGAATLPMVMVSNEQQQFFLGDYTIAFSQKTVFEHSSKLELSDFSSFGTDLDVDFLRPDVAAPGGHVYGAVIGGYGFKNGTSMASPQVAGALPLVLDHAAELGVPTAQRTEVARALLANTAQPLVFDSAAETAAELFYSPRVQGSGLIDLSAATSAQVTALSQSGHPNWQTTIPAGGQSVQVPVLLTNYDATAKTFQVASHAQLDQFAAPGTNLLKPTAATDQQLTPITVPAGQSLQVNATLVLPEAPDLALAPAGHFVDAFLFFQDTASALRLVFPVSVFRGDPTTIPLFEPTLYDLLPAAESTPVPGFAQPLYYQPDQELPAAGALLSFQDHETVILGKTNSTRSDGMPGFAADQLAFSPNDDGAQDGVIPIWVQLRSAVDLQLQVHDAFGRLVYESQVVPYRKSKNWSSTNPTTLMESFYWNGKDSNKNVVADGTYTLSVVGHHQPADPLQQLNFPVVIDTVKPQLNSSSWDPATRTFTVESATDAASGLASITLTDNEGRPIKPIAETATSAKFVLPEETSPEYAFLKIADHAGNAVSFSAAQAIAPAGKNSIIVPTVFTYNTAAQLHYVVTNAQGEQLDSLSDLPDGTYTVSISNLPAGVGITGEKTRTVTLNAENRVASADFQLVALEPVDRAYVHVYNLTDLPGATLAPHIVDASEHNGSTFLTGEGADGLLSFKDVKPGSYLVYDPGLGSDYRLLSVPSPLLIPSQVENPSSAPVGALFYVRKNQIAATTISVSRPDNATGPVTVKLSTLDHIQLGQVTILGQETTIELPQGLEVAGEITAAPAGWRADHVTFTAGSEAKIALVPADTASIELVQQAGPATDAVLSLTSDQGKEFTIANGTGPQLLPAGWYTVAVTSKNDQVQVEATTYPALRLQLKPGENLVYGYAAGAATATKQSSSPAPQPAAPDQTQGDSSAQTNWVQLVVGLLLVALGIGIGVSAAPQLLPPR